MRLRARALDWPLSREEKKVRAFDLYEREAQVVGELLQSKDDELGALAKELKALRGGDRGGRLSLGSTTTHAPSREVSLDEVSDILSADTGCEELSASGQEEPQVLSPPPPSPRQSAFRGGPERLGSVEEDVESDPLPPPPPWPDLHRGEHAGDDQAHAVVWRSLCVSRWTAASSASPGPPDHEGWNSARESAPWCPRKSARPCSWVQSRTPCTW